MTVRSRLHRVLCVLFVLSSGIVYFIDAAPPGSHGTHGIALRFLLALLMFGAWATSRGGTGHDHRWTLLAGVAARLLVAPVAVSLSHDVQRYLWDGAVFSSGLDPYRLAPESPEVAGLRAIWPTASEHLPYATIYPPGAVFLFGAATILGPSWAPWLWKFILLVASLGTLGLAWRALRAAGCPQHLPLVAFSPLLVMEAATGAHLDVVCGLAVAAGLYLAARGNMRGAGLALGAGALVKFLPALVLVPLVRRSGGRSARSMLVCAGAVVGAGYAAAFLLGLRPLGALPVFFERWRFGSPAFSGLAAVLGDAGALRLVPWLLAAALLLVWKAARTDWRSSVPLAMAAPLLVSPVVFPWYLSPLVPAIAFAPSAFMLAWVTTIPLTNEVVDGFETLGIWKPASWPLWAMGLSCIAGVVVDIVRRERDGATGHAKGQVRR
jgi:hypothetical protein